MNRALLAVLKSNSFPEITLKADSSQKTSDNN